MAGVDVNGLGWVWMVEGTMYVDIGCKLDEKVMFDGDVVGKLDKKVMLMKKWTRIGEEMRRGGVK